MAKALTLVYFLNIPLIFCAISFCERTRCSGSTKPKLIKEALDPWLPKNDGAKARMILRSGKESINCCVICCVTASVKSKSAPSGPVILARTLLRSSMGANSEGIFLPRKKITEAHATTIIKAIQRTFIKPCKLVLYRRSNPTKKGSVQL